MKLSNFKFLKTVDHGALTIASVDVETGSLFWKKKTTREIFSEGAYWYFIDNGEYTPDGQVEKLERSWRARSKINE